MNAITIRTRGYFWVGVPIQPFPRDTYEKLLCKKIDEIISSRMRAMLALSIPINAIPLGTYGIKHILCRLKGNNCELCVPALTKLLLEGYLANPANKDQHQQIYLVMAACFRIAFAYLNDLEDINESCFQRLFNLPERKQYTSQIAKVLQTLHMPTPRKVTACNAELDQYSENSCILF